MTKETIDCEMCGLKLDRFHPICKNCQRLLEPKINNKTKCRCGAYHNAISKKDPTLCRHCAGEE